MRKYEFVYILDPREELYKKSVQEIKEYYQGQGANLLKEEEMGKRKLAYEINNKSEGFYYLTQIELDNPNKLNELEGELKLNPNIIRYLKVRI
ncbi:MAG: 30S ribosomal protein S6 [Spirochaetota bacterium]